MNKHDEYTQKDLERRLARELGMDQAQAKQAIDTFWRYIHEALEEGRSVQLHGKGRFYLSHRQPRKGRNPETGLVYHVPERDVMVFRTSPAYARKLRDIRAQIRADEKEA